MNVGGEHSSHTQRPPLTALAIGVSSSVDLSAVSEKRNRERAHTDSRWVELRNVLR